MTNDFPPIPKSAVSAATGAFVDVEIEELPAPSASDEAVADFIACAVLGDGIKSVLPEERRDSTACLAGQVSLYFTPVAPGAAVRDLLIQGEETYQVVQAGTPTMGAMAIAGFLYQAFGGKILGKVGKIVTRLPHADRFAAALKDYGSTMTKAGADAIRRAATHVWSSFNGPEIQHVIDKVQKAVAVAAQGTLLSPEGLVALEDHVKKKMVTLTVEGKLKPGQLGTAGVEQLFREALTDPAVAKRVLPAGVDPKTVIAQLDKIWDPQRQHYEAASTLLGYGQDIVEQYAAGLPAAKREVFMTQVRQRLVSLAYALDDVTLPNITPARALPIPNSMFGPRGSRLVSRPLTTAEQTNFRRLNDFVMGQNSAKASAPFANSMHLAIGDAVARAATATGLH